MEKKRITSNWSDDEGKLDGDDGLRWRIDLYNKAAKDEDAEESLGLTMEDIAHMSEYGAYFLNDDGEAEFTKGISIDLKGKEIVANGRRYGFSDKGKTWSIIFRGFEAKE